MKYAFLKILAGILLFCSLLGVELVCSYRLEKTYTQFWKLADKSSTIAAKQQNVALFVSALERGYANGEFASHNAIWMTTPNNSFEANLTALKSLSNRLAEIQEMKPSSFEYNTAIQQITAQEQGEAKAMLDVFEGCYTLANYPFIWGWIEGILVTLSILLAVIGTTIAVGVILES